VVIIIILITIVFVVQLVALFTCRDPRNVEALLRLGQKWWNFFAIQTLNLIIDVCFLILVSSLAYS
jgi:hypothetical protein